LGSDSSKNTKFGRSRHTVWIFDGRHWAAIFAIYKMAAYPGEMSIEF